MSFGSQRSLMPRRTLVMVSLGLLAFLVFFYLYSNENYIPNIRNPEPSSEIITDNNYQVPNIRDAEPASELITDNNYQGLWQENPKLITYIGFLLRPPSTEAYQLSNPNRKHFTFMEQSKFVGDLYGPGKREGFFVEVGALDGETSSSTLYLERELGFKGLLIEPNPVNYKKLVSKNRKAYILQAALSPTTSSAELLFTFGTAKTYESAGCTKYNCEFTHDRKRLPEAHALLFKSDTLSADDLPTRFPDQRWVWVEVEAPIVWRGVKALSTLKEIGSHQFNWTLSYHTSSDIMGANGYLLSRNSPMPLRANQLSYHSDTLDRYLRAMAANTTLADSMGPDWADFVKRPKPVVWMSSNCKTDSRREDYVEELSRFIKVDKFGKCGWFKCGKPYQAFEGKCWNATLKKRYLFVLAFENSLCNHYLSEKPYNPLKYGLVPIVWGGDGYEEFLPPGSFINARLYHPKELARLLNKLQRDPVAYGRYHIWREYWKALVRGNFCELCHRLHTDPVRGHHVDIPAWRQKVEQCVNPPKNMFRSSAWKKIIHTRK